MERKWALSIWSITVKPTHHSCSPWIYFPFMDMSGVLTPHPILEQTIHPCLTQRRYSKVFSVIRKWSALDMKLDMAGVFCSCNLFLVSVSYLESKASNAYYISDTLETVWYVKTWTGRSLSSNFSNQPSTSFFGLDNIVAKASWELFPAFSLMIRSWTDCRGPIWKSLFKHLPLSGNDYFISL